MKPVITDLTNINFVAPGCFDLPGTKFYQDGKPAIQTVWQLDEEEKKQVMKTGRIYLHVVGLTIQPCILLTEQILEKQGLSIREGRQ